jgi:hypothetical protein
MGVSGRGFYDWPIAKKREQERALERQATKILAADRARQRQLESPKPKHKEPEPVSKNDWIQLEDLQRALRKKGGHQICLRKS